MADGSSKGVMKNTSSSDKIFYAISDVYRSEITG
jgi:hypothetical protein